MEFEAGICVRRGRNKDECQDTALVGKQVLGETQRTLTCQSPAWIVLLDGVGGNAGGREASRYVASELACSEPSSEPESVRSWIMAINRRLLAEAAPEKARMATTLAGVFFSGTDAYLVNAGNTRVYALQGSYLRQLTRDHTTRQMLLDMGNGEAARDCNASEIVCCLGGGVSGYLDRLSVARVFERTMPQILLMTTDGIHDVLTLDEMELLLAGDGTLQEKAERLCLEAANQGSEDDCSAILVNLRQNPVTAEP